MIKVNVEGFINEIFFQNEKSCKFFIGNLVEQDDKLLYKQLACTITKKYINLTDKVVVGKKCNFIGHIDAFKKVSDRGTFIDNIFLVTDIEETNLKGEIK